MTTSVAAQHSKINVGTWVQQTDTDPLQPQQWLFIDFWATWCGPCIQSMDHVQQLKAYSKGKMYVLHISEESPYIIERFLGKRSLKGNFAEDFNRENFDNFSVKSLPHSVLINPEGKVVWTGHPADLKPHMLDGMLRQSFKGQLELIAHTRKRVTTIAELFPYQKFESENTTLEYGIKPIPLVTSLTYRIIGKELRLTGNAGQIASYLLKLDPQLVSSHAEDSYYEVRLPELLDNDIRSQVIDRILNNMKIDLEIGSTQRTYFTMNVIDHSKLWPSNIIEWEDGTPSTLESSHDLQANDLTVREFASSLGNILGYPVVLENAPEGKHDWHVHTAYIDLLSEQLKEEFGIHFTKQEGELQTFQINYK